MENGEREEVRFQAPASRILERRRHLLPGWYLKDDCVPPRLDLADALEVTPWIGGGAGEPDVEFVECWAVQLL
jgi:hypothetical protein